MLASQHFRELDNNVRDYHQSLQTKTEDEVDYLHNQNMNAIEDLTKKLKESMTILDQSSKVGMSPPLDERKIHFNLEEEPEQQEDKEESPFIPSGGRKKQFGYATMKTDDQQVTLST